VSALADPAPGTVAAADVESIARDVWDSAVPEAPPLGQGPLDADRLAVGAVSISGAWQGWVTLEVPVLTATRATAAMLRLGEAAPDPDDVDDALGELANMIGGNVKSLVPAPSTLGLPVVAARAREVVAGSREVCRAELSRDGARLCVRVWQAQTSGDPEVNTEGREAP